jgi:hypothetical protein
MTFGILHLVFGGLGLCITVIALIMRVPDLDRAAEFPGPIGDSLHHELSRSGAHQAVQLGLPFFSLVLDVLLIVAGIGLLRRVRDGRTISILYAWLSIAFHVFGIIWVVAFLLPALDRAEASPLFGPFGWQFGKQTSAMSIRLYYIGTAFGELFQAAYPIVVLIIFNQAWFKAIFRAPGPPAHLPPHYSAAWSGKTS